MPKGDEWSKDEDQLIIEMYGHYSARQISELLVERTRNAVIGRAKRLGLVVKTEVEKRAEAVHKKIVKESKNTTPPSQKCLWPMWPLSGPVNQKFCGKKVVAGKPYCAVHCKRAYRKPGEKDLAA